jgi:hypothetical protein
MRRHGWLFIWCLLSSSVCGQELQTLSDAESLDDFPRSLRLTGLVQPAQPVPGSLSDRSDEEPMEAPRRPDPRVRRSTRGSQQVGFLLASVPKMFGDVNINGATAIGFIRPIDNASQLVGNVDIPLGGRRLKIAENGSPIPDNRVFFSYNHFHNAMAVDFVDPLAPPGAPPTVFQQGHVDRYVVGIERMYWDDVASLEVRMPFLSSFDFVGGGTETHGGNIGNLALMLKYLLYADDFKAVGAGLSIDLPTGSDVRLFGLDGPARINNDAVHLLPYLGVAMSPSDDWFLQFFGQLDFAANGNRVVFAGSDGARYNDQNLLYLDLASGWWLYRNPDAPVWTGLAGITELHYTTAIQNSDTVVVAQGPNPYFLANQCNRFDALNLTAGLDATLGETTSLRVAAVVPLNSGEDDRLFDSELQIQVNRRY